MVDRQIYSIWNKFVLRDLAKQRKAKDLPIPGCAVNTPLGHVVLTAGDVVVNNGTGVQSIANGAVRNYIFKNIDSTNYKRSFVTANPQRNEV